MVSPPGKRGELALCVFDESSKATQHGGLSRDRTCLRASACVDSRELAATRRWPHDMMGRVGFWRISSLMVPFMALSLGIPIDEV